MSVLFGVGLLWLCAATSGVSAQTVSVIFVDRDNVDRDNDNPDPDGLSWGTAYPDLQSALADAAFLFPAPEIWVTDGKYSPGALRTDTFQLISGVGIYGGFNGSETARDARDPETFITILTGDIADNDDATVASRSENSFHVLSGFNLSTEIVLDGLTITAGNANGTITVQKLGGGLSIGDSILTVIDCIFRENDAKVGGGVHVSNGDYVFINCLFENNSAPHAGGLSFVAGSRGSLLLDGCIFINNSATVGGGGVELGVSIDDVEVVIQNCIFEGNSATSVVGEGGGLRGLSNRMLVLNCLFVDNFATNC